MIHAYLRALSLNERSAPRLLTGGNGWAGDEAPTVPERPRVPELDGIRGLAALLVVVHHFTPESTEGASSVWRWVHIGWSGVDLFFVLSGFLITGILLDARGSPHYFRNYYARRTLRIFPLYYGVLLACLVVIPGLLRAGGYDGAFAAALGDAYPEWETVRANQVWLWVYATNFATVFLGTRWYAFAHFWSLAVEEHFYLVWPAVVRWLRPAALARVCAALLFGSFGLRTVLWLRGYDHWACYVLTPCRLDGLAVGALLALAARDRRAWSEVRRIARWVAPAGLGLIVVMFAVQGDANHDTFPVTSYGYTVLAAFWGSVLTLAVARDGRSWTGRVFRTPALRWIGTYSYGVYVFNRFLVLPMKLIAPLPLLTGWLGPDLGVAAHVAAGVVLNVALAVVSWHLYEAPVLNLKRHFVSTPARPVGGARSPGAPALFPTVTGPRTA